MTSEYNNTPSASSRLHFSPLLLNGIFISSFLSILLMSVLSYWEVQTLITDNRWIIHTHEVISEMDSTLYKLTQIESDKRSYIITKDKHFLSDVDEIKQTLNQHLQNLHELTLDNPEQNQRIKLYSEKIDERLSHLNKVLLLQINNEVSSQEGRELLTRSEGISKQVKSLAQEIKAVENVLLKERNQAAITTASKTSLFIIACNLISLIALVIAFILAKVELSYRQAAERNNKLMHGRLRRIIDSSNDMIAAFDKEHRFIMFNDAYHYEFKKLFGKKIAVGMGMDEALATAADKQQDLVKIWRDSLDANEFNETIEVMVDNQKKTYELCSNLLFYDDFKALGAVQSLRDITERMQEHTALQQSYESLAIGMTALEEKNKQITMLVEMSDIMLACNTLEELSKVMMNFSKKLLDFADGCLYIMHPSKNYLEKIMCWGNPYSALATFPPEQCWAIRLGHIHQVPKNDESLICEHIHSVEDHSRAFNCIPLMAQNDIYGLLYLEALDDQSPMEHDNQKLLITAFAELTALALANVRLRENLRHQSIRDPLTGLYNRRYLEDFLFKQLHQAQRKKSSFSVLMLDLDHFKRINDNYGHEAGDTALKEVAHVLQEDIREGDIASRFGGEEFVILFYDIQLKQSKNRAEKIRKNIGKLDVKYGAQAIGPINISIGIASYPQDGLSPQELIDAADKALYRAKQSGRNRVVCFSEIHSSE